MTDTPTYTLCRTEKCRTPREPGYADRGLCQWCEARGLEAIQHLPSDRDGLEPLIWDKQVRGLSEFTGPAPFGPSLPFDLDADALARELAYTAVVWEIAVRERAGLSDAPHQHAMPTGIDLQRASGILSAHFSVLVALGPTDFMDYHRQPATADGPDAVIALTRLHRRAVARIGMRERVTNLPGDCPTCHYPTLKHRDGGEDVWCDHCHTQWPWNEYQDQVALVPVGRP